MFISEIKLQNFRNYKEQSIKLNKKINVFFGDNAQGKTNILESIEKNFSVSLIEDTKIKVADLNGYRPRLLGIIWFYGKIK